jgi:hypothetical protein
MYAQNVKFRIGRTLKIIVEMVLINVNLTCTPREYYIELCCSMILINRVRNMEQMLQKYLL